MAPKRGVRTGGEHADGVLAILHLEVDLGPTALADPVALHLLDALGPVHRVQAFEQTFGVVGDAQQPLLQEAAFDFLAATLLV